MAFSKQAYERQLINFKVLRQELAQDGNIKRIATALRHDPRVDEQRQETLRWMMTVLAEVEKTLGDDKKDLTVCSTESFVQAMIDAATIGIPIDGRKLADLVPRGGRINYQINTAGFVYLVGQHYDDTDIKTGVVFDGDTFTVSTVDGFDHYDHKIADPFQNDQAKMQGIFVALAYSKGGKKYQKVERLSKSEIVKIRGKAQQDYIWKDWFFERAQTAAVKRIAKRQFQTIMGLQEAIAYDNRMNFDMDKALPTPSAGSIIDNLNSKLKPPKDEQKEAVEVGGAVQESHVETTALEPNPDRQTSQNILDALKSAKSINDLYEVWSVEYDEDLQKMERDDPERYKWLKVQHDIKANQLIGAA